MLLRKQLDDAQRKLLWYQAKYEPVTRSIRRSPALAPCVRNDEYLILGEWINKREYLEWLDNNA